MKKFTLPLLLLGAMFTNAQTITQSDSQEVVEGTISCNGQGVATADNSYFRYFDLSDFNITSDYSITQVQFGIESIAHATPGSHPITVTLYATTGTEEDFPGNFEAMTNMTVVAEQTFDVPDQNLAVYSANIAGTVPAGSDLIVELSYLGVPAGGLVLFLGSNSAGESGPTYILAEGCGILEPTPIEEVVPNSDVHLVMNVVGTSGTAGVADNMFNTVSLYPNPTTGIVNIRSNDVINSATITDATGKTINVKVQSNAIDIAQFASGIYFLNLETENGNVTRKIVKK